MKSLLQIREQSLMIWHLVSVCFIEDRPAEEDHVEDDDEAVKY